MRRPLVVLGLVAGLLMGSLPARADVTSEDVAAARARLREVAAELEVQVEAYEAAVEQEAVLRDRLDSLVVALAARERELVLARRAARDRVADMYMTAGAGSRSAAFVSEEDIIRIPARYVYLATVSESDRDVANRLETARRDFEQQRQLVDEAAASQTAARQEMDSLLDTIYGELEVANEEYQQVKVAWDRQEQERIARELFLATSTTTTTPPPTAASGGGGTVTTSPRATTPTTLPPAPVPAGTMVCPVDGATTFRDSWGEPRSGGRGHTGVDMMAARWTPLVAIESGSIYRISFHSQGGLGIYVHGESGGMWYYAHNEAIEDGIAEGDRVVAGQRIAYVGTSGNARTPHVHFAWMPNADWWYQNPYPIVAELCL